MKASRVRVGQIGLGYWGPNLLRNMLRIPEAEVVAIADLQPECLRQAVKKEPGIETMTDPYALISRPFVDAVLIATPPKTHFDLAHAYCHRPMTLRAVVKGPPASARVFQSLHGSARAPPANPVHSASRA